MAQNRKGAGKQLKRFQPSGHQHIAHQAPHGHAADSSRQAEAAGQRGGAQHGRFVDRAPKGPRKGQ
ncbi:MAG TPA: hypothetical protein VGR79_13740 [Stellaceae bacterium]|nr:hypothetical protein [Stellaceae bacterium]